MIVRLVKLTLQPSRTSVFLALFNSVEEKIKSFPGCKELYLFRDINNPDTFFTCSIWDSEENLELYRTSALFRQTWSETKTCFSAPAEAWSLMYEQFKSDKLIKVS